VLVPRYATFVVAALAMASLLAAACGSDSKPAATATATAGVTEAASTAAVPATQATPGTLSVTSSAFAANAPIPEKYTCKGSNVSPPIAWEGAPSQTKAFALVMHDPDAPGGNFTHWLIYDLPASVTSLPEGVPTNSRPPVGGAQGVNGARGGGYTGPCPPAGPPHHYVFHVYALDAQLGLAPGADLATVQGAVAMHTLALGELIGTFQQ